MTVTWTPEAVLTLATDAASAKAGQGLAVARKWASLGSGDGLIWGECQGSGSSPYQTKCDLSGPAFSCSCPSRKFPCKHGIGLMLIWATAATSFTPGALPEWVASWKENREKRAEKAKEKTEQGASPASAAARANREAARIARVAAGLDDLAIWLSDLVRQGFAALGAKSGKLWEDQARRMVDAQAPGVARRLRQIDAMPFAGEGWHADLLDRLARLHLLTEGFRRRDGLAPEVAEDVRAAIGFPNDLEQVRAGAGVRDHWQVIGQTVSVEDRLTVLRTWLIGRDTERPALVLDFAAGGKALEPTLPPVVIVDAELAFFPGAVPLRALVKQRHDAPVPLAALSGGTTIAAAFAAYGSALAKNPWTELCPVILKDVVLQENAGAWSARDAQDAVVPLAPRFGRGWHLLALEGGGPLTIGGEFDGAMLDPLSCCAGGRFIPLVSPETAPLQSVPVAAAVPVPLLTAATASALVGIDRRPPPAPPADDPIGQALGGLDAREPPSRLLAVAAAASLYGRVGRKPPIDASPWPETCPPDTRPECSEPQANRLRAMLRGEHAECLPEWMALLSAAGGRLPFDTIVDLLARNEPQDEAGDTLRTVLGVRGRWLAAKNPKWRKHAGVEESAEPARVWETGTLHERLAALKSLRETDPGRARALVASTYAADPADHRAKFVAAFVRGLSMDDEPFLETALDDRSKEVRRQAAELLRSLPESRLCLRMMERTRAALRWEGGTLVVEPPAACDKALIRDGVEPKPAANVPLGERAWWLREVVSAVPTKAIASLLGVAAAQVVEANRDGEWEGALWTAWTISALRQRDVEWAEPLLEASRGKPPPLWLHKQKQDLLAVLPPDRRDDYLVRRLGAEPGPIRTAHPAFRFVTAVTSPVGLAAGREILGRVRPIVVEEHNEFADPARQSALGEWSGRLYDPRYHDHQVAALIQTLGAILPPELVAEASAGMTGTEGPRLAYAAAYRVMVDRLQFRHDMHREFAL
jgi:hypothetical protein